VNYNPYAPPQAAPPPPAGPYGGPAQPQPWEIGEILTASFQAFKPNAATLIGSMVMGLLLMWLPSGAHIALNVTGAIARGSMLDVVVGLPLSLAGMVIGAYLQCGWIKIWLAVARGQTPEFADLFSGTRFLPMLGVTLVYNTLVGLGFLMCIAPGVIAAAGLCLAPYYVIDDERSIVDALQASWAATNGQKGHIVLFYLVCALLALLALVPCGLGLLVAGPVFAVSFAMLFVRITGRVAPGSGSAGATPYGTPSPWGAAPMMPQGGYPSGGYGPPPGGGYGSPGGGA
jgi:uncharacterized membrane protein